MSVFRSELVEVTFLVYCFSRIQPKSRLEDFVRSVVNAVWCEFPLYEPTECSEVILRCDCIPLTLGKNDYSGRIISKCSFSKGRSDKPPEVVYRPANERFERRWNDVSSEWTASAHVLSWISARLTQTIRGLRHIRIVCYGDHFRHRRQTDRLRQVESMRVMICVLLSRFMFFRVSSNQTENTQQCSWFDRSTFTEIDDFHWSPLLWNR